MRNKFTFLGKFMAKAVLDNRMIDLPFSQPFYQVRLGFLSRICFYISFSQEILLYLVAACFLFVFLQWLLGEEACFEVSDLQVLLPLNPLFPLLHSLLLLHLLPLLLKLSSSTSYFCPHLPHPTSPLPAGY